MRAAAIAGCAALVAAPLVAGAAGAAPSEAKTCTSAEVAALVRTYVAAFNRGDSAKLERAFAPAPNFRWYSSNAPGRRLGPAAFRRDTLLAYLALRHAQRDHLRVLDFRFNGNSVGYGQFELRLERRARDFRQNRPFRLTGKGAVACALRPKAIAVLSLGSPDSYSRSSARASR